MLLRIAAFLALAFSLVASQSRAQEIPTCFPSGEGPVSCTNTFSPGNTGGVYDFGSDGRLTVQFETVLTPAPGFTLTVTLHTPKPTDSRITCGGDTPTPCPTLIPLDPKEFPTGTLCYSYGTSTTPGQCDQYDFTGSAGGPNGVPVRNKDYKGLITLTLVYDTTQAIHSPAFGHAPGDITTFTEDILTGYFEPRPISAKLLPMPSIPELSVASVTPVAPATPLTPIAPTTPLTPVPGDPVMIGKPPGLSSVVALDEPTSETDTFCFLSPTQGQSISLSGLKDQTIEVVFQLFSGGPGTCPFSGTTPLRDKTARLSLAKFDSAGKFMAAQPIVDKEEAGKFHWYAPAGINEYDLSTVGLQTGQYTITVTSSKFSPPQSVTFTLN